MKKQILFIGAVMGGLSSCHIYRNYSQPDFSGLTDSLYHTIPKEYISQDTVSIGHLSWQELFQDSLLQKLIRTGLQQNTDLQVARLRVKEAEAVLLGAKLAFLPSLSAEAEGKWQKQEKSGEKSSYQLAGSAEWEIDVFGKIRNAKQEAKMIVEQNKAYKQAVQTQLIATIANSYYSLLMLDKQLEIGEQTARLWQEQVRTMQELKKAGQTTEIAVAQTESNQLALEASLVSLRQQIKEIENSLSALVGIAGFQAARSTLDNQSFPETLQTGVSLKCLQHRPDVRQREAELAACFYVTNQARAAFYPSVILGGTAGWSNALGEIITNPAEWLVSAVGSLVQPLFQRGKNLSNLKAAKAREEAALLGFRQSLLDAGTEVNNALTAFQSANERLAIREKQITALKQVVNNTRLMMQYSSISYLEVLTAQQSLLQAETEQIACQFERIQGVINLYHSLGGGCERE